VGKIDTTIKLKRT